ncbi:hypothetical protein CALVIDRAFT_553249 [Calocera viscosa TUFC12733]|uniref:F-box domain-containing protein n=1 Tax=Calocera viscosa (strain TUFC12733) TaxID=1330018 RepID=A0A167Q0H7_CALVF|nr:hypothetical protein CALVIDRAFT_553249 [Calocera viscosa TUFC12733]
MSSTMKALPQEIWREVFLAAYHSLLPLSLQNNQTDPYNLASRLVRIGAREKMTMTLAAVCMTWRDIVRDTSALWTDLTCPLTTNGKYADNLSALQHLKLGLALSRHRALTVRIFMYGLWNNSSSFDIALDSLLPHMSRACHIKIIYVKTRHDGTILEGATRLVIPQLLKEYIEPVLAEARSLHGRKTVRYTRHQQLLVENEYIHTGM